MRLLQATVPSTFEMLLLGDTHEGAKGSATNLIRKTMQWVTEKPARYWAHLGDPIEAITTDDKRYAYREGEGPIPLRQASAARKLFKPAAGRCLAFLAGNHDGMLHRFGDLTKDIICAPDDEGRNSMPYAGRTARLALHDSRGLLFKIFLWHPSRVTLTSNAKDHQQSQANKRARLKMLMERSASDCLVMAMGHVHQLLVTPPARRLELCATTTALKQFYLEQGDGSAPYIERDRRWYCATGSFLRSQLIGDDSYAEEHGYPPAELGCIRLRVAARRLVAVEEWIM